MIRQSGVGRKFSENCELRLIRLHQNAESPLRIFYLAIFYSSLCFYRFFIPRMKINDLRPVNRMYRPNLLTKKILFNLGANNSFRVLEIDQKRLSRKSRKFHMLRQKINQANRFQYTTKIIFGSQAVETLKMFEKEHTWWRLEREFDLISQIAAESLVSVAVYDTQNSIISVATCHLGKETSQLLFLLTNRRGAARWFAFETLLKFLGQENFAKLVCDSLIYLDFNGYLFQKHLGFKTYNVNFSYINEQ